MSIDVPQDYAELFTRYGALLAEWVNVKARKWPHVRLEADDILSDIQLKLIQAQILERYQEKALSDLEVQEPWLYLGVSRTQWNGLMSRWSRLRKQHASAENMGDVELAAELAHRLEGFAAPVRGVRPHFKENVFRYADVMRMASRFRKRVAEPLKPEVPDLGFMGYLRRAFDRHFLNWLRTWKRRFQRDAVSRSEEGVSIILDSKADLGAEVESLIDIKSALTEHDLSEAADLMGLVIQMDGDATSVRKQYQNRVRRDRLRRSFQRHLRVA